MFKGALLRKWFISYYFRKQRLLVVSTTSIRTMPSMMVSLCWILTFSTSDKCWHDNGKHLCWLTDVQEVEIVPLTFTVPPYYQWYQGITDISDEEENCSKHKTYIVCLALANLNFRDQDNILADEQHKKNLYLGVWAPWITILSMEYWLQTIPTYLRLGDLEYWRG